MMACGPGSTVSQPLLWKQEEEAGLGRPLWVCEPCQALTFLLGPRRPGGSWQPVPGIPFLGCWLQPAATGLQPGLSCGSVDSTHHLTPPARPSACDVPRRPGREASQAGFLWGQSSALLAPLPQKGPVSPPGYLSTVINGQSLHGGGRRKEEQRGTKRLMLETHTTSFEKQPRISTPGLVSALNNNTTTALGVQAVSKDDTS